MPRQEASGADIVLPHVPAHSSAWRFPEGDYDKLKLVAVQAVSVSGLAGGDLAAARQQVAWVTDARVLLRVVELLRGL